MGNPLFGVDISGIIHANISPGVLPAILIKVSAGTRTPGQLTGGTNPTEVSHPCRGFIDSQKLSSPGVEIVDPGTKKVVLIGDSLPAGIVPETGDKVSIEGATYRIEEKDRDPAAATYTLRVRLP